MPQDYKYLNGQTIEDVCSLTYGSLDYLVKLAQDSEVSLSDNFVTGQTFTYYPEIVVKNIQSYKKTGANIDNGVDLTHKAIENQSLWDVSVQILGGLDNIVSFAQSNGIDFRVQSNVKGAEFNYNTKQINDILLYNYFSNLGTNLGTGISDFELEDIESKNFEDGDNFIFEDGSIYIFEDNGGDTKAKLYQDSVEFLFMDGQTYDFN